MTVIVLEMGLMELPLLDLPTPIWLLREHRRVSLNRDPQADQSLCDGR